MTVEHVLKGLKNLSLEAYRRTCVRVLVPKEKNKAFEKLRFTRQSAPEGVNERERGGRKSGLSEQCSASRGVNSVACRFNVAP